MIPREILDEIAKSLNYGGKVPRFDDIRRVGGGSINDAATFTFQQERYFVKWNIDAKYPKMFALELQGLETIQSSNSISIPGVVSEGVAGTYSYLLLEAVERGVAPQDFWYHFASKLAQMHGVSSDYHGFISDNYIGSIGQVNLPKTSWVEFFVENRLEVMVSKASQMNQLEKAECKLFLRFYERMYRLFPVEKPSLLHGDLWSGNFMVNLQGEPVLIDPAVYFGFREMDIAMTRLFGGFSTEFYNHYNKFFPMEYGWEERMDLCNLYPLLVHLVLFGEGYKPQIINTLNKYL